MGQPAAKQGDRITGSCMHVVNVPSTTGTTPTPTPFGFNGALCGGLSANVNVMGKPAATEGSTANNAPPHIPVNGVFATPPSNQATIKRGSGTVRINGKPAARAGDVAETCDENKSPGAVVAAGTVNIGG